MGLFSKDKKPANLTYEQFRAAYKEGLGSKTFSMTELNSLWLEHKGVKKDDKEQDKKPRGRPKGFSPKRKDGNIVPAVKQVAPQKPANNDTQLQVRGQADSVISEVKPEPAREGGQAEARQGVTQGKEIAGVIPPLGGGVIDGKAEVVPAGRVSQEALDMYSEVADAVHQTTANLIKLFTENAVIVEKEKLLRLNVAGAKLLRKYDTDGQLLEYCPELAYFFTLADIATQTYVIYKRQHPTPPKPEDTPPQVT